MPDVFNAVADATRRHLLERLRTEGPLPISSLSADLPISRQAVTKHLGVLEDAGLIVKEPRGREMIHALTGEPLREVRDWLAPYEAEWDERLARLTKHLTGQGGSTDQDDNRRGSDG